MKIVLQLPCAGASHSFTFYLAIILVTTGLARPVEGKSLADLQIGSVGLGLKHIRGSTFSYTKPGELTQTSNESLNGIRLTWRKQGMRFFSQKAGITWDSSILVATTSRNLPEPEVADFISKPNIDKEYWDETTWKALDKKWRWSGTLLGIDTGPSVEFLVLENILFRTHAGVSFGYLTTNTSFSQEAEWTQYELDEDKKPKIDEEGGGKGKKHSAYQKLTHSNSDWHIGWNIETEITYFATDSLGLSLNGAIESLGNQTISIQDHRTMFDLSSTWSIGTGILFRW
jgi:hypothetical protein